MERRWEVAEARQCSMGLPFAVVDAFKIVHGKFSGNINFNGFITRTCRLTLWCRCGFRLQFAYCTHFYLASMNYSIILINYNYDWWDETRDIVLLRSQRGNAFKQFLVRTFQSFSIARTHATHIDRYTRWLIKHHANPDDGEDAAQAKPRNWWHSECMRQDRATETT